jgi:hypothetical protein
VPDPRRADGEDDRPRPARRATPARGARRGAGREAGSRTKGQRAEGERGTGQRGTGQRGTGQRGTGQRATGGRRTGDGSAARSGGDGPSPRARGGSRDGTASRGDGRRRGDRDLGTARNARGARNAGSARKAGNAGDDRTGTRRGRPDRNAGSARKAGNAGDDRTGTRRGRPDRNATDDRRSGFGPHASHAAASARGGSSTRRADAADERPQPSRAGKGRARVRIVRGRPTPGGAEPPATATGKAKTGRRRPPASDAGRTRARPARRRRGPADVRDEILRLGGRTGERSYQRLLRAADDFADERARDALRILRPLRDSLPASPTVRELLGLSLYRVGRYADAAKELDAYHAMTGEVTQHPVLMDCARALGDHRRVDALWHQLAEASPSADLVTEGRIVRAATLADDGDLDAALAQLRGRAKAPKLVRDHHLRLWYALADLEERAGNLAAARTLFQRIRSHDAAFADVAERLAALG